MPAAWWRAARSSYLASTCTKMETVLGIHLQGTTLYKNVQQLKASNKFPENINSSLEYHGLLDRGSEDKQHAYRPQLHLTASQEGDRLDQNQLRLFAILLIYFVIQSSTHELKCLSAENV